MTTKNMTVKLWNGLEFVAICSWNHMGLYCPELVGRRWFDWGEVKNSLDFD